MTVSHDDWVSCSMNVACAGTNGESIVAIPVVTSS
jgi:hypothetical protein